MHFPKNPVMVQQDAWGLKKLFSYGCRKAGFGRTDRSPQRRDTWVERIISSSLSLLKMCVFEDECL